MPLRDLDLAIVDIETTGATSHYNRIIEIAVLKVKQGRLVDTFSTLVDPERTISPFIEGLTGITNRDLEKAPTFSEVKDRIYELLDGAIFVAHNARFDYSFLKEEFEREKVTYEAKYLCTVRLSRSLFPEQRHHSLDSLIERFGIVCTNRHRAAGDAFVVWNFLQILQAQFSGPELRKALTKLLKTPTLPPLIDESLVKSVPSAPGVYIFYDRAGAPLYVGKSVNMRRRILSHFSGDHDSAREKALCRQVADINTITTSGDLGALLLETYLIKRLSPFYNRRGRNGKRPIVMQRSLTESGYATVRLDYLGSLSASDLPDIVGIFKTTKQAKEFLWRLSREHRLCPTILGLEKGREACSYTHLQRCNGACGGLESPLEYNRRFHAAFAGRKLTPWPFAGPILVEERDETGRAGESYLIDQWCLIACFRFDETGNRRLYQSDYAFDYDWYRILIDHLLKSRKRIPIKRLSAEELKGLLSP